MQETLRKQVKIAKAENDDIFNYKDFAEAIDITSNSFSNWLNGYYNLSYKKARQLQSFINDLLEY